MGGGRGPPGDFSGGGFQFVKKENRADAEGSNSNMASKFAGKALRSEIAKADGQLAADFEVGPGRCRSTLTLNPRLIS